MKTPGWWSSEGPVSRLLDPFGVLYGAATAWRLKHGRPWRAPVPVLCVGNVTAGGAGKTPVCQDLLRRLPGMQGLLRGYGGEEAGPLQVDPDRHRYHQVGDEALLLAQVAPTWVSRDRAAGARAMAEAGAQGIVMDDGLQNPSLYKDVSLMVVDGGFGFGNRRVIPAGPLREPLRQVWDRVQAVVILGDDTSGVEKRLPRGIPRLRAQVVPGPEAGALRGQRVVAFAGIGRPEKFFLTLRRLGADVVAMHPFADHYPYAPADVQPILDEAFQLGAIPITTAKDAVRLPPDQRGQVNVLTIGVQWEDEIALNAVLDGIRQSQEALFGSSPPVSGA